MRDKQRAFDFLAGLQTRLNARLPTPQTMRAEVSARWDKPSAEKTPQEKLQCKENIFLYHFALPEISKHMMSVDGFDAEKAKRSLRGEYFAKFDQLISANTRRPEGHPFAKSYPFEKDLENKLTEIMARWKKPRTSYALNESYPDLSIMEPSPFRIIFDAKLFENESLAAAERALVAGVYEVVFYRGLPLASSEDGAEAGRGYDFGCLLAYDASDGAYLQRAWDSIASKRLFWEGAHVFVMIARGSGQDALSAPTLSAPT